MTIEELYNELLNPTNVIVNISNSIFDSVYLFYEQDKVNELFEFIKQEYDKDDARVHLGFEEPLLVDFPFMGVNYKAIYLWYDGEVTMIPKVFLNKISD